MFIICGLGNSGERYLNTRHNVGFDLIEKIIKKFDFELLKKDKKKEIYTGLIDKKKCLIIKPLTFMNLSGIPIKELLNFYKINKFKLYVIHDDLDLQTAKIKFKLGGGNGGHNGLNSIDKEIGKEYHRIRIGINHPGSKELVPSYVLKKFKKDEVKIIQKKLNKICEFFHLIFSNPSLFLTKLSEENN